MVWDNKAREVKTERHRAERGESERGRELLRRRHTYVEDRG